MVLLIVTVASTARSGHPSLPVVEHMPVLPSSFNGDTSSDDLPEPRYLLREQREAATLLAA